MTPAVLKAVRFELGLTQEKLAARLGYSTSALRMWEQGTRRILPRVENAVMDLLRKSGKARLLTKAGIARINGS